MQDNLYSAQQMAYIKAVPITDVLIDLGFPVRMDSRGFICSPFRSERTGSFRINRRDNIWCDFGENDPSMIKNGRQHAGGTVIDLVMLLRNCTVREAMDYLVTLSPGISDGLIETVRGGHAYESARETKISRVGELFAYSLKDYITEERMIPLQIAKRYCSQVSYKNVLPGEPEPEKDYHAIGFPNRSGAWIIRSQYTDRSTGEVQQIKRNIGVSDCTFIGKDGSFVMDENRPQSSNVAIFEGFFNFLSWLAWKGQETPLNTDVVVLNSTTNAERAFTFIAHHQNVYAYLDNDKAGENCTEHIRKMCEEASDEQLQISFRDCRGAYPGSNDLNDAWRETLRKRQEVQETTVKRTTGPHL